MGKTSNKIKQQWNNAHYTQVKINSEPILALNFKKACVCANESMASVISQFMRDYCKTAVSQKGKPDYSTRRKRRAAVNCIARQLLLIKDAEEVYASNIPDNLKGSSVFDHADQTISVLDEVIDLLESAY
jgi:hypothetical protein